MYACHDLTCNRLHTRPRLFDTPDLAIAAAVLADEKGKISIGEQLEQLSTLMSHDSKNVRLSALKELRRLLRIHTAQVHLMILDAQTLFSTIQSLVEALLKICRTENDRSDPDQQIRLTCADCLGELGAIDPNRLIRSAVNLEAGDELDLPNLAVSLINDFLTTELRAAPKSDIQDRIAFAIQSLLPFIYAAIVNSVAIEDEIGALPSTFPQVLEDRFPPHVLEVIR